MRIIALMNQKGGVGKTTTTVNLGAALAQAGQRVCLIDLDPQAHLTINYGIDPSEELVSLYDVLVEERSFLEAVHKIDANTAIVPASIDLAAAEVELVSVPGREMLLRERIEMVRATEEFDYVLMDCPPSLGLLTVNALAVATEVLIPMQPQFLPLQGVAKLLETVQLVHRRINPKIRVSGIVLTMYDSQTRLSAEVINELENFILEAKGKNLPWSESRVFKSRIRRNIKLAECPSFGQTIFAYGPTSNGANDYRALAQEVMSMGVDANPQSTEVGATSPRASAPAPLAHVATTNVPQGRAIPKPPVVPPVVSAVVNTSIDQAKLVAASGRLERDQHADHADEDRDAVSSDSADAAA